MILVWDMMVKRIFFNLALFCSLLIGSAAYADGAPATNERQDAPRALTYIEAKMAMGYPEKSAGYSVDIGANVKFAIIDSGFGGLEEWLESNPKMKNQIKYISLRKDKNHRAKHPHGFNVLKTALKIMPNAKIYLVEVDRHVRQFETILKTLKKNNVFFASMSLGEKIYWGGEDVSSAHKSLKLLEKYQITFLKSAGNYRKTSHFFSYVDADNDGRLEFKLGTKANGKLAEYNYLPSNGNGNVRLSLTWSGNGGYFEAQLVNKDRKVLASAKNSKGRKIIRMNAEDIKENTWLRILDKNTNKLTEKVDFGLFVLDGGTRSGLYNGQESLNTFSQYESPFLISVGSFGMAGNGELDPSLFSSIGHTNSGEVAPTIMGPGQVIIDGETHNGTSFSTPFIAAMYAPFMSYNIKNYMAASSNHKHFKDGLIAEEISRFGVPDYKQIFGNDCTKNQKIENIRSNIEEENLIVEFELTRNCMEKLDYFVLAYFRGEKMVSLKSSSTEPILAKNSKAELAGYQRKRSETKQISAEPIRIKIALSKIPREYFGKTITAYTKIATLAQIDPVYLDADVELKIKLPLPAAYAEDITGFKAAAIAQKAVKVGGYYDALVMGERALLHDGFTEAQRVQIDKFRYFGALGLKNTDALMDMAFSDIQQGKNIAEAHLKLADLLLAQGDISDAIDAYMGCKEQGDVNIRYRCDVGIMAGHYLTGKNSRPAMLKEYGADADLLVNTEDVHGWALAVFMGKLSVADFENKVLNEVRNASSQDDRAELFSTGQYYAGLLASISAKNVNIAYSKFGAATSSGSVNIYSVLSAKWLEQSKYANLTE